MKMALLFMVKVEMEEQVKSVFGSGLFAMAETAINYVILQRQKIFIVILIVED